MAPKVIHRGGRKYWVSPTPDGYVAMTSEWDGSYTEVLGLRQKTRALANKLLKQYSD